jgi:signal peptidase I
MPTIGKRVWVWLLALAGGGGIAIVIAAFVALICIRLFVGWYSVIPQNGMYPNHPAGSRVFTLKRPYADVSQVARGDVILFERHEKGQRYIYVSRVVGLPGETVTCDGESLLVGDQPTVREQIRSENGG